MSDTHSMLLTQQIQEEALTAQEEVVLRCRCTVPKIQALPSQAQSRIQRYFHQLEQQYWHACRGWLLEQASYAAQLAYANALPFSPAEIILTYETTYLTDTFWSVLWRWEITWDNNPILLQQTGLVWNLKTGLLFRSHSFEPTKQKRKQSLPSRARKAAREQHCPGPGLGIRAGWFTVSPSEWTYCWPKLARPRTEHDFFSLSLPFSMDKL